MKRILIIFCATIFLFSCKKNDAAAEESVVAAAVVDGNVPPPPPPPKVDAVKFERLQQRYAAEIVDDSEPEQKFDETQKPLDKKKIIKDGRMTIATNDISVSKKILIY